MFTDWQDNTGKPLGVSRKLTGKSNLLRSHNLDLRLSDRANGADACSTGARGVDFHDENRVQFAYMP